MLRKRQQEKVKKIATPLIRLSDTYRKDFFFFEWPLLCIEIEKLMYKIAYLFHVARKISFLSQHLLCGNIPWSP